MLSDEDHVWRSVVPRAAALRLRRTLPYGESLTCLSDVDSAMLSFRRTGLVCMLNLSDTPADPPTGEPLLLSGPLDDEGRLPPDTAGWWAA
jgi:alpha-glucosidase